MKRRLSLNPVQTVTVPADIEPTIDTDSTLTTLSQTISTACRPGEVCRRGSKVVLAAKSLASSGKARFIAHRHISGGTNTFRSFGQASPRTVVPYPPIFFFQGQIETRGTPEEDVERSVPSTSGSHGYPSVSFKGEAITLPDVPEPGSSRSHL